MAPPMEDPAPVAEERGDGGVDLQALVAQVEENRERIDELVSRLSRIAGFTSSELKGLRVD